MPAYQHVKVPAGGQKITVNKDFSLSVPDQPIIPYIEGDGTGVDITPVMVKVVDAAVAKAYGGKRKIHWMEIYAGEKSTKVYGPDVWLPEETMEILRDYVVSIKGPLTTPVGGGIRSLNVALRQQLDLYVCLRPVQYFAGVPSPVKAPEKINMVIFRENSEDIYAGIEWPAESEGAKKLVNFLINDMGVKKIRFPATSGIGIKPVSREGTERLMRKAVRYAIDNARKSVTIVHKGNIMKFTEGGFRDWAYALAQKEFGAQPIDGGPWSKVKSPRTGGDIVVKDGRRHRHRSGRQHVGQRGDVRSHARHRAEIRRQGLRQSRVGNPVRRNDAGAHGLEGGGGADRQEPRKGDRRQSCNLRFRALDARRQASFLLGFRPGDDRKDVAARATRRGAPCVARGSTGNCESTPAADTRCVAARKW